jgi:hypothetical protein
MQPPSVSFGPTGCKQKTRDLKQEDFMTSLAFGIFSNPSNGLWLFLTITVVVMFVIFIPAVNWIEGQRKEREAFYKAETIRRLAESSGEGAKAAIELLRQEARMKQLRAFEGMKIGGLINLAVGLGLIVFLHFLTGEPVSLCGLIPGLIGVAMLVYVYFLSAPLE